MQFIGTQQPAKGDSPGYFYSCASIAKDTVLLAILRPWISAIVAACGSGKWDALKVVKSWDFGHRNTRQNTRAKVADPSQARKDRIMVHALEKAAVAKTPTEHADTVRLMAVLSESDDKVEELHTTLFGSPTPDVPFIRDIGPSPEEIVVHLRLVADRIEEQITETRKAG